MITKDTDVISFFSYAMIASKLLCDIQYDL